MAAEFRGAYVIAQSQTEVDGLRGAPWDAIALGSAWRWHGRAAAIGARESVLQLGEALGVASVRARAGERVRAFLGDALRMQVHETEEDEWAGNGRIVLTDGRSRFVAVVVRREIGESLFVFSGELPPADAPLWVAEALVPGPVAAPLSPMTGLFGFGDGALIATPCGKRPVETIAAGDRVMTMDSGAARVVWAGSTTLMPDELALCREYSPVVVGPGQFTARPDAQPVLLPARQRVLVGGAGPEALFADDEVLVEARDLLQDGSARRATLRSAQTFRLILLEHHHILSVGGLACASFHPADLAATALDVADRNSLAQALPGAWGNPDAYGPLARRALGAGEAAIMLHAA